MKPTTVDFSLFDTFLRAQWVNYAFHFHPTDDSREIAREAGVSHNTFCSWIHEYARGGLRGLRDMEGAAQAKG